MTVGGKREGAGRKPSADPASKMATIRLTPTQHAKFLELGGSRWVKLQVPRHLGGLQEVAAPVGGARRRYFGACTGHCTGWCFLLLRLLRLGFVGLRLMGGVFLGS